MKTFFVVAYRRDNAREFTAYGTVKASTKAVAQKRARKFAQEFFWEVPPCDSGKVAVFVEALTATKAVATYKALRAQKGCLEFDWQCALTDIVQDYLEFLPA